MSDIYFDGQLLNSAQVVCNKLNRQDMPERFLQQENLAFQDGFITQKALWKERKVIIEGIITATTENIFQNVLDALKSKLKGINKNLSLPYVRNETSVNYKATLVSFKCPEEHYNLTFIPWRAEFVCQPYGFGTLTYNAQSFNVVTTPFYSSVQVGGFQPTLPVHTITFEATTSASSCALYNTTNGQGCDITHALTTGDILIINTLTQTVTLNGTQIDFSGLFPELESGSNSLRIYMGGSPFKYDYVCTFNNRYL